MTTRARKRKKSSSGGGHPPGAKAPARETLTGKGRKKARRAGGKNTRRKKGREGKAAIAHEEALEVSCDDVEDRREMRLRPKEAAQDTAGDERPLPAVPKKRREEAAIVDALSAYMRQASKHPILDREEEHTLALRWYEQGDQQAALRLVMSNLRLVVKIAWEYRAAQRNLLDLVQEGNIGLMMAVRNFDPYKGVRLSSYAQYWIRAYMLRYIINNFHLVKLGTTQAQRKLFFNLRKEKDRLEREGFTPTAQLLADTLDVKEEEVREMDARLSGGEVSMETPVGSDEGETTLSHFLADEQAQRPDDRLADQEQMSRFHRALGEYRKTLAERDRLIFDKRLIAETPMTLEKVGGKLGVSKERTRQLEERIKKGLRRFLDERGHEFSI